MVNYYVNSRVGENTYTGTSSTVSGTTGPFKSITYAVSEANTGDIISIAYGMYVEHNIKINKNITIKGEIEDYTIIDGTNADTIFTIASGKTVTIQSLLLNKGKSTTDGGAISNEGTLTVKNCTFIGNDAKDGGGAIVNFNTLKVTNCTFAGNTAPNGTGGAICNWYNLTVTACNFKGNIANEGGAIYNAGTATVHLNRIVKNTANGNAIIIKREL